MPRIPSRAMSAVVSSRTDNSNKQTLQWEKLLQDTSLKTKCKVCVSRNEQQCYCACISEDSNYCWHKACCSLSRVFGVALDRLSAARQRANRADILTAASAAHFLRIKFQKHFLWLTGKAVFCAGSSEGAMRQAHSPRPERAPAVPHRPARGHGASRADTASTREHGGHSCPGRVDVSFSLGKFVDFD